MMDRRSNITIIGGGIGGLTTAIALHQKGFSNIVIYERREEVQPVGAGFVVWANASLVLHKLNLLNGIALFGGTLNQMQRWTEEGDYLGGIDITKIDEKIGYKSYAVSKAAFQSFLQKKVDELGITLQNNIAVTAIENNDDGKSFLRLADNSVIQPDIIIGADGRMSSVARKYIHNTNQPLYQNYINWVGILNSNDALPIENNVLDYWGCGERFGIVPISKNKIYWAGCKALPFNSSNTEPTDKLELLKIFEHWPPLIKKVLLQTQETNIKRIPVFDHDPNPLWFKNNVCLLGDAAHASLPTSGQGACQAIEDAWQIAAQLSRFEILQEAFEAYRNIRFEKTSSMILAARGFAKSLFNTDSNYCLERNRKAKTTDYKNAADGMAELWSRNLN
jgi:2-polyprenyl-6-methoxyphenol hydroxylase-like FAD-dependent oxidoreductase